MLGRRWLVSGLVVALLAPAASAAAGTASPGRATPLVNLVDTRVGSAPGAADFGTGGGAGSTYPGAVAPFGMVQLSPDTIPSYGNYGGFYTYGDHELRGFSLTHISGGGCAALGDVPILPTTHAIDRSPSERKSFNIAPEYVPSFSHRGEVAHPGDYRVHLGDGIFTELTATTRTGAMRLTFPASRHASVLFNAGGSAMGDFAASLHVDPSRREISGTVTGGQFCLSYGHDTVHFVAQFSRRFSASGTWTKQTVRRGSRAAHDRSDGGQNSVAGLQYRPVAGLAPSFAGNPSRGAQAGAYVSFNTENQRARQVVVRIGLSTASVAGREPGALLRGAAQRRARIHHVQQHLGLGHLPFRTPAGGDDRPPGRV
jgi:putative alpha-1,2-mannosidase